ncbi:MAG: NAD(+) diphosphatase [Hyphomicrobiaceae bacterium]
MNQDALDGFIQADRADILVLVDGKPVVRSDPARTRTRLARFGPHDLGSLRDARELVFLGLDEAARPGPRGIFAFFLTAEKAMHIGQDRGLCEPAVDVRSLAMQGTMPTVDLSLATTAVALSHWVSSSRYCGRCGNPTKLHDGGWRSSCDVCAASTFPRTDPVVIMLVTDGVHCVLGRQSQFPDGMFSALAGFIEPGETIEHAVAREVMEEVGLAVDSVAYEASQPWPFPHSLMIGCVATAAHHPLSIDQTELQDARWFDRAELRAMLAGQHDGGLWLPGPHAIARWLVTRFADG